ncbi:nucleotide kinase domain-containing protein [Methylocella sp. CPCC 101449]|uniref:nucleotide kinase domain-containing protein n=1 Tax=Methylocella sp. CPCC 101449 TaxID=2987531 RepID=UPI002890739C|nr:nucleotide kinase domain-containing protein [Methylocella sp. CPCC 101449]MDT2022299.1 putative DNA base hypermodification protein [Methylocella sp. CPCC 101449]
MPKLPEPRAQRYIMIAGKRIKITPVFEAYWYFAAERQKIFFRRLRRLNGPHLTEDPILASYRFTNSYRASDRVSQYLISEVIYGPAASSDSDNLFFRILLFKLFNKIETWEAIEKAFGTINLDSFDFELAGALLSKRQNSGMRNYSAAYIMPSCASMFDEQAKHMGHLKLLQWMLAQNYPARLKDCRNMEDAFALLRSVPSIGAFLAYQFVTDLNYSPLTNFSEMEFVMAGPGALDGISKCFDGLDDVTPADVIKHMAEHQEQYLNEIVGTFDDLWGRPLQLIDCQNVFCEISKYSRVAYPAIGGLSGRTRIKQKYRLTGSISTPFYPPDWGLNQRISEDIESS